MLLEGGRPGVIDASEELKNAEAFSPTAKTLRITP